MDNITSLQDKNTEAIKTHIPCVDEVFGGLRRGCLYSFCAGTGVGKSTILLSTAKFLAAQGYKVLFLSVEMDVVALSQYITEPLPTLGFCNFYDIPEYWKMVESKINEFDIICYDYLGATLED